MPLSLQLGSSALECTEELSHNLVDPLERLVSDVEVAELTLVWGAEPIGFAKAHKGVLPIRRVHFRVSFVLTLVCARVAKWLDIWKVFIQPLGSGSHP